MVPMLRRLTALCGLCLLASASFAAESHAVGGTVFVNNVPVLQLKGENLANRAADIVKTLRLVDDEGEVKTQSNGHECKITVGSTKLLVVSPEEASVHGTGAEHLAETWANQIRDALSLPPLKFSVDFLRVPLGVAKDFCLVGSLAFGAEVSGTNDAVLRVQKAPSGFQVRCVGVGDAQIKAINGNSMRTLGVSVRPFAGSFPQAFVAEVTGAPALESTVAGAVAGCIRTRLISLPTATCSFEPFQGEALGSGTSRSYSVGVRLRAPEAFDAVGYATVTVRNIVIPKAADTALWYSNAPESVRQPGPLFSSFLKRNAPVRFLYHHVDASTQPLLLRVEAINDSDQTAKLVISPGDSKPDKNPVRAGMTAAIQFIRSWATASGEVVILPPHTTAPISIRRLSPNETASGLCDLRLIDGPSEIQVRTDALPPFVLQGSWFDASLSSTPWREAGTHAINDYDRASYEPSLHVYPNPYKDERMDYTVGGRYGFLLVGQKPISGEDHTNNLDGNFGVIYKIKATIHNPTDSPTDVDLVFEASAGYMAGIFLLDGNMIQTPFLGPKSETRVARFHLATGATKTFDIVTLPVSGGSYPATLFLRPVEESVKVKKR